MVAILSIFENCVPTGNAALQHQSLSQFAGWDSFRLYIYSADVPQTKNKIVILGAPEKNENFIRFFFSFYSFVNRTLQKHHHIQVV